ncbi:MAG: GSCFA domain-containing protein, partial [Bacteroidales bacterium]|nr:GSCFA domain-containing protein [Bacteroidales bacterium]
MLKLQTPVNLEPAPVSISYEDRILVLGSCFAAEIGQRLTDSAFQVLSNPFGTLYNPVSVGNALSRLASGIPFTGEDAVEMGAGTGRICSFSHHTSFARPTTEAFLEEANRSLEEACTFWKSCNKVIITLGTAWAFRFNETGETVANCLKRPAAEFTRYRLSVSQVRLILE